MGKRSCSAEYSVGTENTTRGGHGRKIAAAGSASAFAFMSPEPFVAYDSMAARLRSILLQPARLLEAALLLLLGVLTAFLAVLIVQVPLAVGRFSIVAQGACEAYARESWGMPPSAARLAAYLGYLAISLLCGALALAATLPSLGGSRHAVGSGIPEMKAIMSGYWLPRYLSLKTFLAKILGLTSALAAGYVIGKEGPLVHLSATLSVLLMKLSPFADAIDTDHTRKRSILAAACAVGVVGTFGTPIGGVLFSVEVTSVYYMVGNLWKGFFGAAAALVCFQLMADYEIFEVPRTKFRWEPHVGWEYGFFLGVGVLQGLLSATIVHLLAAASRALRRRKLLKNHRFSTGLGVCFVCATMRFVFPPMSVSKHALLSDLFTHSPLHQDGNWHLWAYGDLVEEGLSEGLSEYLPPSPPSATRGGGALASDEHSEKSALFVLLLFTAAELLCLIASIILPIPNGCFFPIFVIGAASGRLYAEAAQLLFGFNINDLPPAVVSVTGAAALAAGTTQTLSTALICLS